MFWNIVLMVGVIFVALFIGYCVGKNSVLLNAKIGVYDVVNNQFYYDKDITANSLENENAEIGVVDLVYLSESRKARSKSYPKFDYKKLGEKDGELSE